MAGEPLENNVLKCRLKPVDRLSYKVSFTLGKGTAKGDVSGRRVRYTKPGEGQRPTDGIWQFYPFYAAALDFWI